MKLYTLKYDCNLPTTQQINTATNSTFLIGIKATRNGEEVVIDPTKVTLIGPTGTLSASSDTVNGYVTFQMSVLDEPSVVQYAIDIEGDDIKDFKLIVNTYKSQVGDTISSINTVGSTATIAGTFADNTEFSYDVYVK